MNHNSFLGRGINDYLYAKSSVSEQGKPEYNWPAVICSQGVEKILKAVIETEFAEDGACIPLMRTHNLRTIVVKIKEKYPDCAISAKDCKWLGDFYYDARYPGDDFITVSYEDATEAIRIAEETITEVEKILTNEKAKELFAYCKEQTDEMKRL